MTIRALLLSSSLVLSGSVWAQDREDNTPQDRLVVPRLQPQIQPRLQTPIRRPVNADRLAGLRKYLDNPAVLNMRIKYSEGRWSAEADKILPCNGPSKPASRSRQRVVVQLLNEDQKPVMRRVITNPRIILDEHHRGTELLDEMEFTLSMPYVEGAAYFVLTELNADEKSRNRAGQIVARERVSIQEISSAWSAAPRNERADCQPLRPKPGDPRRLLQPTSSPDITPDIVKKAAENPDDLIDRGISMGLRPDEVRLLIYGNRERWSEADLNSADIEAFLKRYEDAYRRAEAN